MLPGFVQYDKKGEIVLSDGRFAAIHKIKVGHIVLSRAETELMSALKLIAVAVKIEDKVPTNEDLFNLNMEDFYKIMEALNKK